MSLKDRGVKDTKLVIALAGISNESNSLQMEIGGSETMLIWGN